MKKTMFDKLREKYHYERYKIIKNMIKKEGNNLLDIGCGKPCDSMENGAFISYMGYGIGMDIESYPTNFPFKKGSIHNIPFPNSSFDVISAQEILEHVENPELALKEVQRVLKSNGIFVLSTPNNSFLFRFIWFFWEKTLGKMWEHTHITELTKKQWLNLLASYFEILEVKNFIGLILMVKLKNTKP